MVGSWAKVKTGKRASGWGRGGGWEEENQEAEGSVEKWTTVDKEWLTKKEKQWKKKSAQRQWKQEENYRTRGKEGAQQGGREYQGQGNMEERQVLR